MDIYKITNANKIGGFRLDIAEQIQQKVALLDYKTRGLFHIVTLQL